MKDDLEVILLFQLTQLLGDIRVSVPEPGAVGGQVHFVNPV